MAFECGICATVFSTSARIPLILECGHTFCRPCVANNLGVHRCCPYCRHPIQKHVDELPRNYALENAMEAANLPLVELMDRWGLANAERMMVKPEHLQLVSLMSRKGQTGEVWKGALWGKPVAVKVLPLLDVDSRQLECLRREVAVLLHTTGECKQVCIYKGFCVKDGRFAIIMKLYSYSLAARVARAPGGRLPLPAALKYGSDITKGLVELHRLGVIAADLKPDNVLVDDELGDAVIADFGISSVVTSTLGNGSLGACGTALRSSGALRGTPNYMAPEQFAPGARPTNKVDIWGFGATLLHMLTGVPPWHQDTLLQICTAVGVAKQVPPLPEGLPRPLHGLLLSCFDADPARRPTAVYLLRALQALGPVLQQQPMLLPAPVMHPQQQQQQQQAVGQGAKQPMPTAAAAVDDKQSGLDQYLAQLGLRSEASCSSASSGGGGYPSAPPLPSHGSAGCIAAAVTAAAGASGVMLGAAPRPASSSSGSSRRLPRVLWNEDEALHEQQQQQQAGGRQQGGRAPHHGRSVSEHVSGLSSRGHQQQQQLLQALQPHEVAGGAQWAPQQQQHARCQSEVPWRHADEARMLAGAVPLPTHYETSSSPSSAAAAAGMEAAAAADGAVKRQRQQWQIPALQADAVETAALHDHPDSIFSPRADIMQAQPAVAEAEAAVVAHSKWPARHSSGAGAAAAASAPAPQSPELQPLGSRGETPGAEPPMQCTNCWDMPSPPGALAAATPDAAAVAGSGCCGAKSPLPLKPGGAQDGNAAAGPDGRAAEHSSDGARRVSSSSGSTDVSESIAGRAASDASGPASVSGGSRSGSTRRNQRTLSALLLGRAGSSRAAMDQQQGGSCSTAAGAAAAAGSASSGSSYSSGLAAIRMAFGPASPDRMLRGGALSNGSMLAPAAAAGAGGAVLAATATVAAAAGSTTAVAAGKAAALTAGAAAAGGGTAMQAGKAVVTVTATAAAAGTGGVVAAMASRLTRAQSSSKGGSIQDSAETGAAATPQPPASVPLSPSGRSTCSTSTADKPSRWRTLFGSPSRRRSQTPTRCLQSPVAPLTSGPSVLDGARSTHSSSNGSCLNVAADGSLSAAPSCSGSPSGHQRQHGAAAGAACKAGLTIVPPTADGPSIDLPKLSVATPGSTSAAQALSEAERAAGACSPLKAHAHNLSLHHARGSTESSPAPSPNPQAAVAASSTPPGAAAASRPGSPTKQPASPTKQPASPTKQPASADGSSSGEAGGSSSSGSSHSQALGEAVQLEATARSLSASGRHEEAEAALRSSLALLSKQLGPGHPNTIAATTRLALQLNRHGKHREAERLLRSVLTHKQAMLGRKHPQVAAASINLAACLYSQAHYHAATRLYTTALDIRRAALGDTHADTAACLNNLALCQSRLGDWPAAEALFREALSARVATLGQLHPDVAVTAHQLGHCLGQMGQHSEALVFHKQALWVRQQQDRRDGGGSAGEQGSLDTGGSSSSSSLADDLLSSYRCVALCLTRLGCDKQAGEHLSSVLQARSTHLAALNPPPPPGSPVGRGSRGGGGRGSSASSGAGAAALDDVDWSVLAEGDSRLSKAQADALLAVAGAAEELGRCLSRQGQHAEAEELYWRALETRSQVLGSRHELVVATEEQLRGCLAQQC